MTAPTLVDTWFTRGEVAFPDSSTLQGAQRSFLWMLKAAFTNELTGGSTSGTRGGSSNWTVAGSSNGVAAGMDGVDRWGATYTAGNLVRAAEGVAHSWIVLQSPAALGVWLCINYNGGSEGQASLSMARSAFSGGSVTTKPTATNETAIGATTVASAFSMAAVESTFGVTYRFGFAVNAQGELHCWANRVSTGLFWGYFNILQLRNQTIGDNWPVVSSCHFSISGRGAGTAAQVMSSSVMALRTPNLSARVATGGGVQYTFGGASFEGVNPIDVLQTRWLSLPVFIVTGDASQSGFRGNLQDIYIVGIPAVGGSFPSAAAQTMMVVGNLLVPSGVVPAM